MADDFTVTGDELDRCLDRAEKAEAERDQLRAHNEHLRATLSQSGDDGRSIFDQAEAHVCPTSGRNIMDIFRSDEALASFGVERRNQSSTTEEKSC